MTKTIGIDLGTTFSVAAFMDNGQPKIIPNREGKHLTPSVVAFSSDGKRLVGDLARRQAIANPGGTIASIKRHMGSDYSVSINQSKYIPQEIASLVLRKIKNDAEAYLGEKVEKAVITVPAYFNDRQRQATCDAGTIAGLEVIRIISEPTSAALAYGLDREDVHTILVWDLGGGTFDVSILELGNGVFEVKAVNGNTWLGGDDWDQCTMNHLAEEFKKEHGIDLRENKVALQRLKEASEAAKIELSFASVANVRLPFIVENKQLEAVLTREKFEEITRDLLGKLVSPTRRALADASLRPSDIDRVVLVGGSTRMPAVQILAGTLLRKEPYKDINPDEVVALGAAIQAAVLTGQTREITLIDVTPLSLGIETLGGIFSKIIKRNTTIPTSASQIFTTARDNQPEVDIHVLQGEREMAADNNSLSKFKLTDIPLAARGVPRIEVVFDLDVNGIVHVSAQDLYTGKEQNMKITSQAKLSSREIEAMIADAERYAQKDKKRRSEVEIVIKAENVIYAAREVLKDLSGEEQELIEEAILYLKLAIASRESSEIEAKTAKLGDLVKVHYRKQKCRV